MYALLRKEINAFFSSITGYLVLFVFFSLLSLFLWLLPTDSNILQGGYATIDGLFIISPWVFLFLIPAITMRSFADEKKSGTIELLLTKPLSDLQIIFAKYLAGMLLVIFSLLPTLVYFYSVYQLGNPKGNIDVGGTWGSYIGLFFLASVFVSVGIFVSSISENQVVAFVLSTFLCFFLFIGFDQIAAFEIFNKIDDIIYMFGINYHYTAISKGVVDSRDLIYFVSISALFFFLTKLSIESRRW